MSSLRSRSGGTSTGNTDKPEIEILAKLAGSHGLTQQPVGRRHDANVHGDGAVAAEPLDALGLDRAQHLGLQRQRHFPDLVEEDRAALGHFELADLALRRRR